MFLCVCICVCACALIYICMDLYIYICILFMYFLMISDDMSDCASGTFVSGTSGSHLACPNDHSAHGTCGSGTKNNFCPDSSHFGIGCCRESKCFFNPQSNE